MRTILVLLSLWGTVSLAGLRRWRRQHAVARRDDQLRALLAGRVPLPRMPLDSTASSEREVIA